MSTSKIIRAFQYLLILALPFAIFYWMSPIGDLSVGNDYVVFSIDHQLALQYSLERDSFPLYAPGFAGGNSSAALTLGQLYHPLPHLAALLPGYWKGAPLEANTVLKLISIGLAHLILFLLLLRLRLSDVPAFIISFITVYNLRMLDMYRYGASLENYIGFIMLIGAMGRYYLRPSKFFGPLFVIISTYLLVTGGHPQMMYFGLLGAGLFGLFIPFVFPTVGAEGDLPTMWRFYRNMGLCLLAGILLGTAYILPFYTEFIRENSERVLRDYKWSLAYSDTWSGVLNSFFRPLYSNVHGAFGSSSLILEAACIPVLLIFQKRLPKVLWFLFGAILLVFLISLGDDTPAHFAFWKVFPLADTFRTPGRVNLILPPLFLLTLAWFFSTAEKSERRFRLPGPFSPAVLFSMFILAVYILYNVFVITRLPAPTYYHPAKINEHSHDVVVAAYIAGIVTLVLLPIYLAMRRFRIVIGILLCLSVLIQTGIELRHGTWIVDKQTKVTLDGIDRKMKSKLKVVGLAGFGMASPAISEQLERSILDPSLGRFYRAFHTEHTDAEANAYIGRHRKSTEAVVVADRRSKKQPQCAYEDETCKDDRVTLVYSSYNMLRFEVEATEPGLFTVAYPYTPRFKAEVDGAPSRVFRANGYALGIFLDKKGKHAVTIRYTSPATQIGIVISFGMLCVIMLVLGWNVSPRPLRYIIPTVTAGTVVLLFILWARSLYSGQNLQTRYTWYSKTFSPPDNLAFGKAASMTGISSNERPYDYYAGRAVDGSRSTTIHSNKKRSKQWWQVDLGSEQPVRRVVIYNRPEIKNHLPLLIQFSSDGRTFETALTVDTLPSSRPPEFTFEDVKTRYIRLKSSGEGPLKFKEVEVYGPPSR